MIIGVVNAQSEATIRLPVRAADGREQEMEVILDTGFNGSLTLPPAMIASLGLQWRTRGLVRLANGPLPYASWHASTHSHEEPLLDPTTVCCPHGPCPARGHTGMGHRGSPARQAPRGGPAPVDRGRPGPPPWSHPPVPWDRVPPRRCAARTRAASGGWPGLGGARRAWTWSARSRTCAHRPRGAATRG